MHPGKYQQQAHDEPGFLEGRRATGHRSRPLNQAALQALVAQRWQDFAAECAATSGADRLRRLVLLRRGLAGFVSAAQRAQERSRAALVQYQKTQFVQLGRALTAWRQRVELRQRLAAAVAQLIVLRARLLALRCWQAWQGLAAACKAAQHAWTRAEAYHAFCLMAKVLDGWRDWLRAQHTKRRNTKHAAAHCARTTRLRALHAWRHWVHARQLRRHQMQLAAGFDRLRLLSGQLAAWRAVMGVLQDRRQQASTMIQQALYGLDLRLLALSLRGWRQYAVRQAQLRDFLAIAQRLDRYNTLHQCWRGWLQLVAYRRHLQAVHARFLVLRPRLLLRTALAAWGNAVSESHTEAGQVYYRALQLPRAFAAWRQAAAREAELARFAQLCSGAHSSRMLRSCLAAWRSAAACKATRRASVAAAEAWRAQRCRGAVLAAWRSWAKVRALRQLRVEQAVAHHAGRQVQLIVQRWRQLTRLRKLSACWWEYRLQREVFARWRSHSAYKAGKADKWRRAVRHRYLHLLRWGWRPWAAYHAHLLQKRSTAVALLQHRQRYLARQLVAVWRGPFLAAARRRRAQAAAAEGHCLARLLKQCWLAWQGPFLAAARARRQRWRRADSFCRANALHAALAAWQVHAAVQLAKRARLEELRSQLLPSRLCAVLHAWWLVWMQRAVRRRQACAAGEHRARALLWAGLASWVTHHATQARKRQQWLAALVLCSRQRLRRALLSWRDAAHTAATLRRIEALECEAGAQQQQQQCSQQAGMRRLAGPSSAGPSGGLAPLLSKLGNLKLLAAQHLQQQGRTRRVPQGSQGQQTVSSTAGGTAGGGASPVAGTYSQLSGCGGMRLPGWQAATSSCSWQAPATPHPAALLPASRGQATLLPPEVAGLPAADGPHSVPAPASSRAALGCSASGGTPNLCYLDLLHRQPLPEPRRPLAVGGAVVHKEASSSGAAQLAAGPADLPGCCAAGATAPPLPPPGAENQLPAAG